MVEAAEGEALEAAPASLDVRAEEYAPQDDDEEIEDGGADLPPIDPDWPEALVAFVADIASVTFSNPDVATVAKVEAATTVVDLVDSLGLVCQFSAEMTDEDIAAEAGRMLAPGDWVSISTSPFTTQELLTVTMNSGDVYVIDVTDALVRGNTLFGWKLRCRYSEGGPAGPGGICEANDG